MSLDALARVGSYFGSYLSLSSKGTVQATVKTAKLALCYCMYPPGSKFAAQLSCPDNSGITLKEFQQLVTNCSAQQIGDNFCTDFEQKTVYGECRAICTLQYNGSLNSCFDETLRATVPSCAPPDTNPLTSLYIVGGFGATVLCAGLFVCCIKKEAITNKIKSLFSCCSRRGRYVPLVSMIAYKGDMQRGGRV